MRKKELIKENYELKNQLVNYKNKIDEYIFNIHMANIKNDSLLNLIKEKNTQYFVYNNELYGIKEIEYSKKVDEIDTINIEFIKLYKEVKIPTFENAIKKYNEKIEEKINVMKELLIK